MRDILMQKEDFSDFSLGGFPFDPNHSAMGEYHYDPPKGYQGNWYCPMADYSWKGPFWSVAPRAGKHWMENQMVKPLVQDPWRPWSCLLYTSTPILPQTDAALEAFCADCNHIPHPPP